MVFCSSFIVAGIVKSPWFKGVIGEFQVNLMFKLFLPKKLSPD